MNEREMQELLWRYPERFLHEPLKQFAWETSSDVGRADLVFEDKHGRLLIVELKRGKLPREAISQLLDYFGMMKLRFPSQPVELMVVANAIPAERRLTCESRDIECREIGERVFRDVAAEVGYRFKSEEIMTESKTATMTVPLLRNVETEQRSKPTTAWSFASSRTSATTEEFLSRCDDYGKRLFIMLFEAQRSSTHTRITWDHESGFSLQFYFHRIGFAPMVWGFPRKNREGKHIRQRIDFPFDFAAKKGVSEAAINEFGQSLSSILPLAGGTRRPSIPIDDLNSDKAAELVRAIFAFATAAATK